jgi:hypothetical protein
MIFELPFVRPKKVTIDQLITIKDTYMLKYILVIVFVFALQTQGQAQCSNKVEVQKAVTTRDMGIIEIKISTSRSYSCTLYAEKATGNEVVKELNQAGNQILKFEKLDPSLIYRVDVNFVGEENKFCKQLSRSQIILSSK